jgi:hypothetical protein
MRLLFVFLLALASAAAQPVRPAGHGWRDLFNGKNLDGWESVGEGFWTVMREGTLAGQRDVTTQPDLSWTRAKYLEWLYTQAWLYTKQDFGEFDLRLEYWLPFRGNSGISIRDPSRARYAVTFPGVGRRTPSKIGYEIQLANQYPDNYPTGSVYGFQKAETGYQIDNDWNTIELQIRNDRIRVKLNGHWVAEHPGEPGRPLTGPIGLQLHDRYSVVLFRHIRIREITR